MKIVVKMLGTNLNRLKCCLTCLGNVEENFENVRKVLGKALKNVRKIEIVGKHKNVEQQKMMTILGLFGKLTKIQKMQ